MTGAQIFTKLLNLDLNYHDFDWLENQGLSEFELLISVVLTQNTNWKNVLKALENLKRKYCKLRTNQYFIQFRTCNFNQA